MKNQKIQRPQQPRKERIFSPSVDAVRSHAQSVASPGALTTRTAPAGTQVSSPRSPRSPHAYICKRGSFGSALPEPDRREVEQPHLEYTGLLGHHGTRKAAVCKSILRSPRTVQGALLPKSSKVRATEANSKGPASQAVRPPGS